MNIEVTSILNNKKYVGEWRGKYYPTTPGIDGTQRFKIYVDQEAVTVSREELLRIPSPDLKSGFRKQEIADISKWFLNMNNDERFETLIGVLRAIGADDDSIYRAVEELTNGTGLVYDVNNIIE